MGADKIQFGQGGVAGIAGTEEGGALFVDQQSGILDVVDKFHMKHPQCTALASWQNQLPLSAVTTAQVLLAVALNPGLLNRANRRLRLKGELSYNTTSTNVATLTLALTLGGTNVLTITVTTNPTAGATLNFNGTQVAFIANGATPVGNQVALGTTATLTATALYTFLAASTDVNISKATYTNPSNGVVAMTSATTSFVPKVATSAPLDLTFVLSTTSATTLVTITTSASNTAASTGLPVRFELELTVPAGNAYLDASAVVAKGLVLANLSTAAANALTSFADTNIAPASITIGTNPATGVTMNINGTTVTFIANGATPVGNQVALGTTATLTATALYTFLAASTDVNISKAVWTNPSNGVVLGTTAIAGYVPYATGSVAADFTFSTPALDLTQQQTLVLTLAASAAVPVAQLLNADLELVA